MHAVNTWSGLLLNKSFHEWGVAWRWSTCGTVEVLWKPSFASITAINEFVLFSLMSHTFLLTIQFRFSVGLKSGQLAGQFSAVIPWSVQQLVVVLALWAGAKSSWRGKLASPWSSTYQSTRSSKRWLCCNHWWVFTVSENWQWKLTSR